MGMKSYLYDHGTQVIGWEKNNYVYPSSSGYYNGYYGTITFNSTNVFIRANYGASGKGAKLVSSEAVDLTNVSAIKVNVSAISNNSSNIKGASVIATKNSYGWDGVEASASYFGSTGLKTINVASLTGSHYISLVCMANVQASDTSQTVTEIYLEYIYDFNVVCDSNKGSVTSSNFLDSVTLQATAESGYAFGGYYVNNVLVSTSSEYTFTLNADTTIEARFIEITLSYDSLLGDASFTDNGDGSIDLTASVYQDAQFMGWYVNSSLISDQAEYTYSPVADTTIEARFEPIYQITDSVDGNGAIQFTRGTDQNDVTFSVIPDANWHFVKYVISTSEYTATPLQLHLTQDISITAYFEEDDKFRISCPTGKNNISVYISDNDVYSGTVVTLWARPFPDYNFVRWGDGETTNPRQITVTENVTLTAEYQRVTDTNGIYQYRCFIKDQLNLTDPPKSFMVVDTFDVNVDLLTNATSSITVMEMPTNVNEGDVLVLYDPKGQFLYNGVITSIEDKTINCSQMQSFYNGSWVYQTSSKTYLEQEIATVLELYAQGKQKGSSYTDPLVAQRLGGITVDYVGSITSHLPTRWSGSGSQYEVLNMEDFIYELYQKYSIVFDFEINFSGTNYVHIKVPNFSKVSVGNNMFAIKDMSPVTEIEETNRLIVYGTNNTYRKTYVATKSGIVEEPSSTANRFNITNTEIVFSDDALADLVSANLPSTMYNHKLTFTLIIKNFIYEFGDFNLGGEMDVYYNDDYYGTVLTGYEITKESNQNITEAKFTCGKVRVALTKMLTMGVV